VYSLCQLNMGAEALKYVIPSRDLDRVSTSIYHYHFSTRFLSLSYMPVRVIVTVDVGWKRLWTKHLETACSDLPLFLHLETGWISCHENYHNEPDRRLEQSLCRLPSKAVSMYLNFDLTLFIAARDRSIPWEIASDTTDKILNLHLIHHNTSMVMKDSR